MTTYLVGNIRINDTTLGQQYVDGVRQSLQPFAAEVVFRGTKTADLAGEHPYEQVVLIRFADQSMLQQWFTSKGYQSLIPLRDRWSLRVTKSSWRGMRIILLGNSEAGKNRLARRLTNNRAILRLSLDETESGGGQ